MMTAADQIRSCLTGIADRPYAETAARFFKTGPGEYGEGDVFIGVRVPLIRSAVKRYIAQSDMNDIKDLLASSVHEERMAAVLLLVSKFETRNALESDKRNIYDFYIQYAASINNWDLVDISAPRIPGVWLYDKDRSVLYTLAKSGNLWKKRISIIATQGFIRRGDIAETFRLADVLTNEPHDLMHKAVGWMLREAGKKNEKVLKDYLGTRYTEMPRTMLRYAIEKFPEIIRKKYLRGEI